MSQKTIITKLLQSVTEVYYKVRQVLQSVTNCYYKVRQVLQSVTGCYYKVRQVLQSATVITKWHVTTVNDLCYEIMFENRVKDKNNFLLSKTLLFFF